MITIRPASELDSDDLLAWRNDEATRFASVTREPVSAREHAEWLTRALADPGRVLYIGTLVDASGAERSVGMCRFDRGPGADTAEVSINLNPSSRGRGLAKELLASAIATFCALDGAPTRLTAIIRADNAVSARVFAACGFTVARTDSDFVHMDRAARLAGDLA